MESKQNSSPRETVIVVMDANRNKVVDHALDWALNHVVGPKGTVMVLEVLFETVKKALPCFPLNMGINNHGIWEKIDFSISPEVKRGEFSDEIERKREQYQASLQQFYKQYNRNEVKLEIKLAAGLSPEEITIKEYTNYKPRWIVLDSNFKKQKLFIYENVGCNVAIMKAKDVVTYMPFRASAAEISPGNNQNEEPNGSEGGDLSLSPPPPPCLYPLQWRDGFPKEFSLEEFEEITDGFADENFLMHYNNIKLYEGKLKETLVMVESYSQTDERFWSLLAILSRIRHRNIMNFAGWCSTGTNKFILYDYPCFSTLEVNLQNDETAANLPWKARLCIALEVGGSLRYLHEECPNGPIAHLLVQSRRVAFSHGCSAMLCDFHEAKRINEDARDHHSLSDELLWVDVHDYGVILVELITGKSERCFPYESDQSQSLMDWAVPFLKNGPLSGIMDSRVPDTSDNDAQTVQYMAQAALLCLNEDSSHRFSISEILAVVQGNQLPISSY